jgi:hypothetical protein
LNDPEVQGKVLDLSGIRDRAYVLLGEVNFLIDATSFFIFVNLISLNQLRNQLVLPIELIVHL